jgi:hypothetical protein
MTNDYHKRFMPSRDGLIDTQIDDKVLKAQEEHAKRLDRQRPRSSPEDTLAIQQYLAKRAGPSS